MIKKTKVHDELMKKVLTYEKQRSYSWIAWFLLVIGSLVIVFGISSWVFGTEVMKRQTLELLDIFQQDWEIIREFWQDTIGIFIEELPQDWLFVVILAVVSLLGVIWITRNHRRRVLRRLRELASYGRIRNNT